MLRRLAVLLALLALPCAAQAQLCGGTICYFQSGGVISTPILLPDGTAAAPGLAFANATGSGMYKVNISGGYVWALAVNGSQVMRFDKTRIDSQPFSVVIPSTSSFGWNSIASETGASDVNLTRAAAATLQLGVADAAAPVNQTFQAQGVAAGTSDVAGATFTLRPGIGRGLAIPGTLVLNRSLVTTTGNSAQAQQSGLVICGTKTLSNTSATAQTIATITTTTTTAGGAHMFYSITASDGTNVDVDSGNVSVSWNNLAATVAATMSAAFGGSNSVVAPDTLTALPTATVATNVVSIKVTPTWANTVPTTVTAYFTFLNNSTNAVVCQ